MSVSYWGYHLIVDCSGCDQFNIKQEQVHRDFLKELIDKIDMVAYGEPVLAHFATHDPSKGGYTIMQMIETSNICGHFVDMNGEAYIDIFSCKPFDLKTATNVIQKYYAPKSMRPQMIYRKAL